MLRQELPPIIKQHPSVHRLPFRLGRRLSPLLLCLLLLATVVSGMLATDWSEVLRRVVILHLRDLTGREVHLGSARLSLRGGLLLSDLSIYPRGAYRHPLFAVKQLAVRVDFLRLQFAPGSPLSAIRQVDLNSPYVYLTRNARGVWNIDDLLRGQSKGPASHDRFCAEVMVRNGEVVYQDKVGLTRGYPLSEHLVGVSMRLRPSPGGYMPFRLTARDVSGHLHSLAATGGMQMDSQRMLCDIQFTNANLKFVRQFLNKKIPLQVQAGRGDGRWQLLLARDPVTKVFHTTLEVKADIRDVRGTLTLARETIPCVVSHGQLRVSMDLVELIGMQGTFGGVPATVSGTISTHKNTVMALRVHAVGAPAQRVAQLIPGAAKAPCAWGGLLDATVDVTGTAQHTRVVGHVAGLAMRTHFGDYTHIACDVEYADPALICSRITGSGFGGALAGDLWLSLSSKDPKQNVEALFYGQVANINPQAVNAQLRTRQIAGRPHQAASALDTLTGSLSGPVTVRVSRRPGAPGCLTTTVLASCTGTAAITVPASLQGEVDASLQVNIDSGAARDSTVITTDLQRIQVRLPEGIIRAHGTVDADDHLALAVQGSAISLAAVGRRAGRADLAGDGYLLGQVTGALGTPAFAGNRHLKRVAIAGHAFSDLTGDVTASTWPMRIALAHACLMEGDSCLQVAGTLTPERKGQWQSTLSLEMPRTSLAVLGASLGMDIPVKGYVEGKVELTGLPDAPRGHGQLLCRRPTLVLRPGEGGALECDRVAVDFTVAHGAVNLNNAELVYQGEPVTITGAIPIITDKTAPVAVALQAHAPAFDVGIITELLNTLPLAARPGVADQLARVQHQVHGTLALDANIGGRLKAGQALTADALLRALEIHGSLHETKPLTIAGVPYQKLAVGLAYRPADRVVTLSEFTVQRVGAEGKYTIGLASADDPGTLRLAAAGTARNEIDMKLVLKTTNLNQLRRDALTIATASRQHPLFASLEQFAHAVPTPFSGRGQIAVSLAGAADAPFMRAELTLGDIVISNNAVPDIDGAVTFDAAPREIAIEHLKIGGRADLEKHPELQGVSVDVSGKISLPAPGKEAEGGPLNLSVDAQNVNLGLLGLWLHNDGLKAFSGEATIVAAVDSTTAHPHLKASVDINHPVIEGMAFDTLQSAIVTMDEEGIWIGNWLPKGEGGELAATTGAAGGHRR